MQDGFCYLINHQFQHSFSYLSFFVTFLSISILLMAYQDMDWMTDNCLVFGCIPVNREFPVPPKTIDGDGDFFNR